MNQEKNLSVLITGGTRGIGRAIAFKMAENGYDIIAVYRNNDIVLPLNLKPRGI